MSSLLVRMSTLLSNIFSYPPIPPIVAASKPAECNIAIFPTNYRMAEIILEMPDADYRFLTIAQRLQMQSRTSEAFVELIDCDLSHVLHTHYTESDGYVAQCAIVRNGDERNLVGVATIRLSTMLLEDGNMFEAFGQMGEQLSSRYHINLSCRLFTEICTLSQMEYATQQQQRLAA